MPQISAKQEKKSERMEMRVSPSVKKVIQHATAISGLAPAELALESARRIIEDHEQMVLRGADRHAFLQAVANPAPPSKNLVAALRRHRQVIA